MSWFSGLVFGKNFSVLMLASFINIFFFSSHSSVFFLLFSLTLHYKQYNINFTIMILITYSAYTVYNS